MFSIPLDTTKCSSDCDLQCILKQYNYLTRFVWHKSYVLAFTSRIIRFQLKPKFFCKKTHLPHLYCIYESHKYSPCKSNKRLLISLIDIYLGQLVYQHILQLCKHKTSNFHNKTFFKVDIFDRNCN